MPRANPELKAECIRLRITDRMSLREIHESTGASKGSLSKWLKPHPLTQEEKNERLKHHRYETPKKDQGQPSKHYLTAQGRKFTRLQKAKIAEAAVLFRLALHQLNPFGSVFDGDKTDWVVEVPATGRIFKVQVKWALHRHTGLPCVSLQCRSGSSGVRRYLPGEFDFLVGYNFITDTCYVWSWDEVASHKARVSISEEAEERWDKMLA